MPHGFLNYQYLTLNYTGTGTKSPLLIYEHRNNMGTACYVSGAANCSVLANAISGGGAGPQDWYNTAGFQAAYCANGCIIVIPYADQSADTTGTTVNFGGFNDTPGSQANEKAVASLIHFFLNNFNADPNRVYVTGDDMGGIGSWAAAMDYGVKTGSVDQLVTAAMPFGGSLTRPGPVSSTVTQLGAYLGTPGNTSPNPDTQEQAYEKAMGGPPTVIDVYASNFDKWANVSNISWIVPGLNAYSWANSKTAMIPNLAIPMGANDDNCCGEKYANANQGFLDIKNGLHDATFNSLFQTMKDGGFKKIYARLGWEFNGDWYPWNMTNTTVANWVDAWRHVAALAHNFQGMTILTTWCPNYGDRLGLDLTSAYPGDDVVDIIAIDIYGLEVAGTDTDPIDPNGSSTNFSLLYAMKFAADHNKPFAYDEVGAGSNNTTFPDNIVTAVNGSKFKPAVDHVAIWTDPSGGNTPSMFWPDNATTATHWKAAFAAIKKNSGGSGGGPAPVPTSSQLSQIQGGPFDFAINGSTDTTASMPSLWTDPLWTAIAGNSQFPGPPAGGVAGSSPYHYLKDTSLGHDVWTTYRPLPTGKPMLDLLFGQKTIGLGSASNAALPGGFLHTAGNQTVDGNSNNVKMACVGYNVPTGSPSADMSAMRAEGFNCARADWYDALDCPGIVLPATIITTVGPSFTDTNGVAWSITASRQLAANGVTQTITSNVVKIALVGGVVWQQNTATDWYSVNFVGGVFNTLSGPIHLSPLITPSCNFATMDAEVSAAAATGMKMIFAHRGNEGVNGTNSCRTRQANGLWYDLAQSAQWNLATGTDGCGTVGTVNYDTFRANWLLIANHFKGNATVIGFDLHNEPMTAGGATWGGGGGGDAQAMANDIGAAVETVDPGALIIVEGIINNGNLFNGLARGSATYPATYLPMDLSTVASSPLTCCTGEIVYSVHDFPTAISGSSPDSGATKIGMMNAAWGFLESQNLFPVWIGEAGASLDNTNGQIAAEQAWASTLTQYVNGQLGGQGGPSFSGCVQPIGGDWWSFGNNTGQQPNGTKNPDGTDKAGQQAVYALMSYVPCSVQNNPGGGGGGGGTPSSTTWNPSDLLSMTLSGANQVATVTAATSEQGVRSTSSKSSGKVCFEVASTTISPDWAVGITNAAFSFSSINGIGTDSNSIAVYPSAHNLGIFYNNTFLSGDAAAAAGANGDAHTICADFGAKLVWITTPPMRARSHPWNNDVLANQNPATGTGGLSFAGLTCPCFIDFNNYDAGPAAATLNVMGPFAVSTPSGFSVWQGAVSTGGKPTILIFGDNDNVPKYANDDAMLAFAQPVDLTQ